MTKWSDAEIDAVIESLEKDMYHLSDGFGWYAGQSDEEYNRTMRRVARHILSAVERIRQKEQSSQRRG